MRRSLRSMLSVTAGLLCATSAMAASSLSTGFESPSYTLGGLSGQQGWSVSGGGTTANVVVSNLHPDTGAQHIRMTGVSAQAGSTPTGTTSPELDIFGTTPTTTSWRLAIAGANQTTDLNNAGATYTVLLDSLHTGKETAEMDFNFDGSVLVDNGGASLADTGAKWSNDGVYHTWAITVDANAAPANQRIRYFKDGVQFFSSDLVPASASSGGTTVDTFQFFSDNFQKPNEVADIDNFSMAPVPEPMGVALLTLGGLILRRRRVTA